MFDINKCKIDDKGHMWAQTKDGHKVRILCKDGPSIVDSVPQPLVGYIDGCDTADAWCIDGRYFLEVGDDKDLVNIPEKHVVWVNVHQGHVDYFLGAKLCPTKEDATRHALTYDATHVACIKVEFTEGEGL